MGYPRTKYLIKIVNCEDNMNTLLILGATSDIARATALIFARDGWDLLLAGRNLSELESIARDLEIRTTRKVHCLHFDACDEHSAETFWDTLPFCPDAVLCAIGYLGDQIQAEKDITISKRIICSNFSGLVPVLSQAGNAFAKRGSGCIIGLSSVAGERGRASNYMYGAAKAGLTTFLSGMRQRLAKQGIQVITVIPGFVNTRMTEGMNLPKLLTASPELVAKDIVCGIKSRKDVVYSRWYWRWIMRAVCALPEWLFKSIKL